MGCKTEIMQNAMEGRYCTSLVALLQAIYSASYVSDFNLLYTLTGTTTECYDVTTAG